MTNTNKLTQAALALLTLAGCNVWRNNAIPVPLGMKNNKMQYRKFAGRKGVADIIGFVRVKFYAEPECSLSDIANLACFIAVEIKTGSDELSSDQIKFRDELVAAGGLFYECRDDTRGLEQFLREKGILK